MTKLNARMAAEQLVNWVIHKTITAAGTCIETDDRRCFEW